MNERKPEPWHEADDKPSAQHKGAPIGTHSLTGGGASVGMPTGNKDADAEPGDGRQQPREEQPDPLAEPRAQGRGILGPKP